MGGLLCILVASVVVGWLFGTVYASVTETRRARKMGAALTKQIAQACREVPWDAAHRENFLAVMSKSFWELRRILMGLAWTAKQIGKREARWREELDRMFDHVESLDVLQKAIDAMLEKTETASPGCPQFHATGLRELMEECRNIGKCAKALLVRMKNAVDADPSVFTAFLDFDALRYKAEGLEARVQKGEEVTLETYRRRLLLDELTRETTHRHALKRVWEREFRGKSVWLYHGTGDWMIPGIVRNGLHVPSMPMECRNAIEFLSGLLVEPEASTSHGKQRHYSANGRIEIYPDLSNVKVSFTFSPDVLRAAAATGLPAFAFELLDAKVFERECWQPRLQPRELLAEEHKKMQDAFALGAEIRSASKPVVLQIRLNSQLLQALRVRDFLSDFNAFIECVVQPCIERGHARSGDPSALESLRFHHVAIAFDADHCSQTEVRIGGPIPPDLIYVAPGVLGVETPVMLREFVAAAQLNNTESRVRVGLAVAGTDNAGADHEHLQPISCEGKREN